jgi:hypothetical protein
MRRRHWLGAAAVAGLAAACSTPPSKGGPAKDAAAPEPSWVVDPRDPGPARPPTGRSLFDFLVARAVPYPFPALVSAIGSQVARRGAEPPLRLVLIPRGRSLQRDAARPDFFRFPRAILAVDFYAAQAMWPQVVEAARANPENVYVLNTVNRALFHTGDLKDKLSLNQSPAHLLLLDHDVRGPVNLTGPRPVTNAEMKPIAADSIMCLMI